MFTPLGYFVIRGIKATIMDLFSFFFGLDQIKWTPGGFHSVELFSEAVRSAAALPHSLRYMVWCAPYRVSLHKWNSWITGRKSILATGCAALKKMINKNIQGLLRPHYYMPVLHILTLEKVLHWMETHLYKGEYEWEDVCVPKFKSFIKLDICIAAGL